MIDRVLRWGIPQGMIVADAGYGNVSAFREGLDQRRLSYVVGVDRNTGVRERPVTREGLPKEAWRTVAWREGEKCALRSRFATVRIQPSHQYENEKIDQKMVWLLAGWPEGEDQPTKFWFSNLGEETDLRQLVGLAKMRAGAGRDGITTSR